MKTIILKRAKEMLTALMLPLLAVGCTDTVEPSAPAEASGLVSLTFQLRAAQNSTTNPDGHPEEPGADGEVKIYDGEWLHVYVHDAVTNELKFHFDGNGSSPLTSMIIVKEDEGVYNVKVSTRALVLGRDYRISILTNCLDHTGDLYNAAIQFQNTADNKTFLQNPHWMAFSGFRKFHLPQDIENKSTIEIGTVWLLRAQARIDVRLTDEMASKWTIESGCIAGVGNKLYSTSYPAQPLENVSRVSGTEDLTMDMMFNPRRYSLMANPLGTDIAMKDVDGLGRYFRIYLPEQDNPMSDGQEMKIMLTMLHKLSGTRYTTWLYLRNYPGTEPVNIVRNHIYRYTVESVKPLFETTLSIIPPSMRIINVPSFN